MTLLLRDVDLDGRRVDVRVAGERVAEIGSGLSRRPGEDVVDGDGGTLLPGLVDHHLHLHAWAAARASMSCGPPDVTDEAGLAAALGAAPADDRGWVRGVGYHESIAGPLDARVLDRLHAARPVRVQDRSGALWTVNTVAASILRLDTGDHPGVERTPEGRPTGRLWRADAWLRERLPASGLPDLAAVGRLLAGRGVTAITDATPDLDDRAIAALTAAVESGAVPQHLHLLGVPLGRTVSGPRVSTGPYKIVLPDSGLPSFADLVERIATAHALGRPIAAHCVTREALVLLLAALDDAGGLSGDRIEHGSLIPAELVDDLARRRIAVVTQPGFISDRGDAYLRDVDAGDLPDLYRCAGLRAAGVPLALSSDAPYGPADPWLVLRSAVERRTRAGALVGPLESLDPTAAVAAMLAPVGAPGDRPRAINAGAPADMVLLRSTIPDSIAADEPVRTVLIRGERTTG